MGCMMHAPRCAPVWGWLVLHELEVDATSPDAGTFTGAGGASGATVEYLVEAGAAAPVVSVDIAADNFSTTWKDTAIAPGFHVHQFGPLPAGAKLKLSATDAMARLRWCETVCC